jgi:signal transduction histidine kinase
LDRWFTASCVRRITSKSTALSPPDIGKILEDDRLAGSPEERFSFWLRKFEKHAEIAGIVRDREGRMIAHAELLQQSSPPIAPIAATPSLQFDNVTLPNQDHMRRLTVVVPTSKGDFTLMLLAELEHIEEELGLVVKTLMITIPVTLIVAAVLGYFLAYKSLLPVEQLRQLTNEITAERLNRRLPVYNPSDELGLLAQTINSMIARLEQSFAEVRRFTADASHELRTPLAVIRSEAELGIDAAHDPENVQRRFASILEECSRLVSITGQLLTLSREDAGVVQAGRAAVPVLPLLLETIESLRPFVQAKRQELTMEANCEAVVAANPDRLRQVFHNLLDNAIKYTPAKGHIRVTLHRRDTEAIVSVEDTGIGILPEHLPQIFDRFYRVSKSSDTGDGAGLGLSIVQSIVMSLGGHVDVVSAVGEGSVFRIVLPVQVNSRRDETSE